MKFFDLHVHSAPDLFIRRYSLKTLESELEDNDSYAVFKSHINSSVSMTNGSDRVYGSIVLNEYQGGINLAVVVSQSVISSKKFIVWLPTLTGHTKSKLKQNYFDKRLCKNNFITHISYGRQLKKEVVEILKYSAENNIVVATGHANKEETLLLVKEAKRYNTRLILTHPFYHLTNFSVEELYNIAREYNNCYFECNILMNLIGDESLKNDIELIESVGEERVFVSSDLGQIDKLTISEGYNLHRKNLIRYGDLRSSILQSIYFETPKSVLFGK